MALTEHEKYLAKLILQVRDGDSSARATLAHEMEMPAEMWEWYTLSMRSEIYWGSADHIRLNQLNEKYETDEVLATQTM